MRKLLLILALFSPGLSNAQIAARIDQLVWTTPSTTPPGDQPPVYAVINAKVNICGFPAVMSGGVCTNKVTTYTDSTLATACPSTAQLTAPGTSACISTTGLQGALGLWYNAATQTHMTYTLSTAWGNFGPYDIDQLGGSSASGVSSLNSLTGALSITGDSTITVTPSGSSIALHATGSGGAFSGGLGSSYQDVTETAAPAHPASGNDRLYTDSTTHLLTCLTASGTNCMPTGGGTSNTIWNGSGAPSVGIGINGDFYIDTAAHCLYGPKAGGVWPGTCTSLIGPTWYGSGSGVTPVVTANWSAFGAGCATTNTTTVGGNPAIQVISTSGTQNTCGVQIAASGTFTHIVAFYGVVPNTNTSTLAVGFTDGTKTEYCGLNYSSGYVLAAVKNTALTGGTFSAANGTTGFAVAGTNLQGPIFFRLRSTSGTTLACDYSPDGVNWVNVFSDTTPFLIPSAIYFGGDPRAGNAVMGVLASYD